MKRLRLSAVLLTLSALGSGAAAAPPDAVSAAVPSLTRAIDTASIIRLNTRSATTAITKSADRTMPELIRLSSSDTPAKVSDKKNITADSAKIISPRVREVLDSDTTVYEIEPTLSVDSVMLFVRHSQNITDTLGVIAAPPYKTTWRYAHVPNQDQMHLQFGYVLYCPDSVTVTSPPLPHRWMIDRGIAPSKKRYHIKQLTALTLGEFEVNGDLTKWKLAGAKEGRITGGGGIGTIAEFKLLWSAAALRFIIDVKDDDITAADFVELHLDFHRDRARFSGVNHRSLRFMPRGRSMSFVVDLTDSGFVYNDSINTLIADEMERASATTPNGYTIEASIPITVLSDFEFPPSRIGFDVSVMNDNNFYSWAGTERFFRYSPRGWGEAKITQAGFGLKIAFFSTFVITALAAVGIVAYTIITSAKKHGEEQSEEDVYAQMKESVIGDIEKTGGDEDGEDNEEDDYDENEVRRRWR